MKYNFDEQIVRRHSDCYKWDSDHATAHGECLPLWVADMDFQAAPAIRAALQRRLDHGVFGYTCVPERYYDAIVNWFSRRHGWTIAREHIIYTIGVVPAISAILRALTRAGDKVLVHTPAYNCFFSSIANLACEQLSSPLICRAAHFEIDWADFEAKCHEANVLLLCNPHNPTGRIWTKEELTRIATICEQNNVFVISDEIHCEFEFPGEHYTPYATVAQTKNYCVCTAASKAFNVAGLQCANIIAPDDAIRARIDKAINIHEVCDINPFGMEALIAAYNECEDWLTELNDHIYGNYRLLCEMLEKELPTAKVTRMEGTYLAWVNIQALLHEGEDAASYCAALAEQEKVLFNDSLMYGADDYIRINMACPRPVLQEALTRFIRYNQ